MSLNSEKQTANTLESSINGLGSNDIATLADFFSYLDTIAKKYDLDKSSKNKAREASEWSDWFCKPSGQRPNKTNLNSNKKIST